jgi:hypothetical protein
MGAQGFTTVDFGAFPGKSDATVTITGQAGILAGSLVEAWIRPVATADHTAGEHVVETLKAVAHSIVVGVGFDITVMNTSQLNEPLESSGAGQRGNIPLLASRSIGYAVPDRGGEGTRIYGLWTVAWVWN